MRINLFDLPEGMDDESIVTVKIGSIRRVYGIGVSDGLESIYGYKFRHAYVCDVNLGSVEFEIGPAPWLGDLD